MLSKVLLNEGIATK